MSGGDSCDQTLPQLFGPHFRFFKAREGCCLILLTHHPNHLTWKWNTIWHVYICIHWPQRMAMIDFPSWLWLDMLSYICFYVRTAFVMGTCRFSDYSQYIEPTWCFGEMGAPWHQFFSNDLVSGGRHWQQLDTLPERCLDEKNTWANRQCWCKGFCHHLVEHLIMCKWRQMILFESQLLDSRCY